MRDEKREKARDPFDRENIANRNRVAASETKTPENCATTRTGKPIAEEPVAVEEEECRLHGRVGPEVWRKQSVAIPKEGWPLPKQRIVQRLGGGSGRARIGKAAETAETKKKRRKENKEDGGSESPLRSKWRGEGELIQALFG